MGGDFILKNHTALTIAECLFTLSSRFGSIWSLISDQGGEMKNANVKYFCQRSGCHKIFSSSYKAFTSGLVERNNRTILQRLKMELMGKQNWSDLIPRIQKFQGKKPIPGMPEFRESFRGIPFHIPAPPP